MAEAELVVAELRTELLALHVDEQNAPAYLLYKDLGFELGEAGSPLCDHFADCLTQKTRRRSSEQVVWTPSRPGKTWRRRSLKR